MVPIKSPWSWLSIGTKMVKFGPLLTKLWPCKVNHHFTNQYSPLCTGFGTYVKTSYLHINSRRFFVHKETRTTLRGNKGGKRGMAQMRIVGFGV